MQAVREGGASRVAVQLVGGAGAGDRLTVQRPSYSECGVSFNADANKQQIAHVPSL